MTPARFVPLVLILGFAPVLARAQCVSAPACALAPCRFSQATSWSSGAGCQAPPDKANEAWLVSPGHAMVLDAARQVTGHGDVQGDLSFDPSPLNRDEHGYRNLIVTTGQGDDLACRTGGSIRLRAGDRLRFDTRGGVGVLAHLNGCVLDFRGSAFPTTASAVVAADDGPACGNASPVGRQWTITPAAGLEQAKVGRRVIVQSGPLRNRHFEIADVTSGAIVLCSHLADAVSLGERLTPRALVGQPPGPGTIGHHSTPAITAGNESCTGPGSPHTCCRAAGQGTCADGPDPSPGDALLIVDDGTIDDMGGSGWRLVDNRDNSTECNGEPCSGSDPFPIVQYMNLAGFGGGGNNQGVDAASFSVRSADQAVPDFVGNNLHGFKSDYGIVFRGIKNTRIEWNAIHDSAQPAGTSDNYCQLNVHQHKRIEQGRLDTPAANVLIRNNVAWGTKQCAIQVNDAENFDEPHPLFQASGIEVSDNLVYGGCAVGAAAICDGIQVHACRDCQVRRNVCYDMHNSDHSEGSCIKIGGTAGNDGTDVSFNWLVNGSRMGVRCVDDTTAPVNLFNCLHVGITGNFISHFRSSGGRGGRWYGNVVRNFGLTDTVGASGIDNPIRAFGDYVGIDDAVAATPLCATSPHSCGRAGVAWYRGLGNNGRTDVVASDLVLGRLSANSGGLERHGMDNDRYGTGGVADFNGVIAHVTHDNRAVGPAGAAPTFAFSAGAPPVPVTWSMGDLLAGYKNDAWLVQCSPAAGLTEIVGEGWSLQTSVPAEGGGAYSPDCTSVGTLTRPPSIAWKDRTGLDYGLLPGAPELTAGSGGTAIGARAFLFRSDLVAPEWAGTLAFDNGLPAPFSNGTPNDDADDDAVMDFLDNCPAAFNPSQYDADADGAGNDCDCAPADPGAWGLPGEAELFVVQAGDGVTALLSWNPPTAGGLASAMSYDLLRSPHPWDFDAASCLESNSAAAQAVDPESPLPESAFFYLVRARNVCGAGAAHHDSAGIPLPARDCP